VFVYLRLTYRLIWQLFSSHCHISRVRYPYRLSTCAWNDNLFVFHVYVIHIRYPRVYEMKISSCFTCTLPMSVTHACMKWKSVSSPAFSCNVTKKVHHVLTCLLIECEILVCTHYFPVVNVFKTTFIVNLASLLKIITRYKPVVSALQCRFVRESGKHWYVGCLSVCLDVYSW
jgi:hypothetical protein